MSNAFISCTIKGLLASIFASTLVGCASTAGSSGGTFDKVLDLVGLQVKPPPIPEVSADTLSKLPPLAKKVTLRVHAGDALNVDASGRALSLVLKIYAVKGVDAFTQLPYSAFQNSGATTVDGAVAAREVVLTPGQKYEVVETMPSEATHLAVVALFRAPDEKRWHFVFDVASASKTGVTLGAHACALSVAEGQALGVPAETTRLAGVRCN